jgi:hypothetical protein
MQVLARALPLHRSPLNQVASKMPWHTVLRHVQGRGTLAVCGGLALSACGAHYAQVPARLSLQPYGRVALVTFSTEENSKELSTAATRRFAEALLSSQSGIELLELTGTDSSLRKLAAAGDASALAQALGREKNVPAVFLGQLRMSGVKPSGHLSGVGRLNVRASVSGELTVRLVSTSTGGTVWRSSSAANGTVGNVAISDNLPAVAVRDPNEAYGEIVDQLVRDVTRDLRPSWVKQ